ncbi:hypothetical protein AALP_AA3G268900 [Arabis alpina]|uniref:Uncharacterized protein n=1 Tax=Arabis alpina TaxID=50452 RepID=A0A087HBY1_ARAAL|nr:hypothetical protein AALP_AA3G268900 [Arabis alpina]
MICGSFFKPKFYKKSKHSIKFIKIELDSTRKKKNAMVYYLKRDIAEILKTGHENEDKAYKKVEELLEELRILSSYDLICDFISSNLSLMMNQRECPGECREAVSSLIYATAWGFVMNLQPSEAEAGFDICIPPNYDYEALERRLLEEWAPAGRNMSFEYLGKDVYLKGIDLYVTIIKAYASYESKSGSRDVSLLNRSMNKSRAMTLLHSTRSEDGEKLQGRCCVYVVWF